MASREAANDYTTLRIFLRPSPGYELSFGTSLAKVGHSKHYNVYYIRTQNRLTTKESNTKWLIMYRKRIVSCRHYIDLASSNYTALGIQPRPSLGCELRFCTSIAKVGHLGAEKNCVMQTDKPTDTM